MISRSRMTSTFTEQVSLRFDAADVCLLADLPRRRSADAEDVGQRDLDALACAGDRPLRCVPSWPPSPVAACAWGFRRSHARLRAGG